MYALEFLPVIKVQCVNHGPSFGLQQSMKSKYLQSPTCCLLVDKRSPIATYVNRSDYKLGSRHMMMVNICSHSYELMQHRFIKLFCKKRHTSPQPCDVSLTIVIYVLQIHGHLVGA